MDLEFSWMTYFVSLLALMGVSLALTLLWPPDHHTGDRPANRSPTNAGDDHTPAAR